MRLKYFCVFFMCIVAQNVLSFSLNGDTKITNKEWYCSHICKNIDGESMFDKRTEKCYCTLRKMISPEEKESRDLMRKNAKMHNLHLIIEEFDEGSNRVRRQVENEENTQSDITVVNNVNNEPTIESETNTNVLEKSNPENKGILIVEPKNNIETNNNEINDITNTIPRRARPILKPAGTRRIVQPKPIDGLAEETKRKIEELIAIQKSGQSAKEAQAKAKELQGVVSQLYSNLKYSHDMQTIQERISQMGEKIASRHRIVAPESKNPNDIPDPENEQETAIGARRPRHRLTPRPRAEELERHKTISHHPRSKIHRQRLGVTRTENNENAPTTVESENTQVQNVEINNDESNNQQINEITTD